MSQRFLVEVVYEVTEEFEVRADTVLEAEVAAAKLMTEKLVDSFEESAPGRSDFNIYVDMF